MNVRFLAIAALPCALSGCALTSKSDPWVTRYFSPEYGGRAQSARAEQPSRGDGDPGTRLQLRLGRVSAEAHLRQKIAFRTSDHELNYYEDRRWTEKPETYLRRALARTLFEERGVVRVVSGNAPTLEIELLAFEEIADKQPRARVQASVMLHDQRLARLEQTVMVERPIAAASEQERTLAVVAALADSLHASVARIAQVVLDELVATRTVAKPCRCRDPDPAPAPQDEPRAALRE